MKNPICIICFCPSEKNEQMYGCIEPSCTEKICEECLLSLIMFSENSGVIPKCPSKCNGIFTLSNIKGIPKVYIRAYATACFKYIMKDKGDLVKKRMKEVKILADLRDERIKYLEKEYPKAVTLVAKLAFKDRLRTLDKQKGKIVSAQVNKTNRICINATCNGFLDPNFVCMTCGTEFCGKCEKKEGKDHECLQEDLDSVNIVNGLIKCPGCTLPVFKDEGCDSITCSNCNTNFTYSTGKLGGHGSHNMKLQKTITLNKKEKLSNILSKKINNACLKLLLEFEALEPVTRKKESILYPLRKYLKTDDEDLASIQIAMKIDKYYNYIIKNKQYHKFLADFEELIDKETDTDKFKAFLKDAIKKMT